MTALLLALSLATAQEPAPPETAPPVPDEPTLDADGPDDALRALMLRHALERKKTQTVGMSVLLGWSVANIGVAAGGWALAEEPEWRHFHQMSMAWNGVNLALAIPGLVGAVREDPRQHSLGSLMQADRASLVSFWMNTGLDVGWMASGAWLWERGVRTNDPLLLGFGRSMVLQGGFLFLFDLTMGLVTGAQAKRFRVAPEVGDRLGITIQVDL